MTAHRSLDYADTLLVAILALFLVTDSIQAIAIRPTSDASAASAAIEPAEHDQLVAMTIGSHLPPADADIRNGIGGDAARRLKRDFDVQIGASYEETIGAELSAEISGSIWRNEAGSAHIDGSATYAQHFDSMGTSGGDGGHGNARAAVSFHYHHD